jgi:hypothetical protein
LIHANCKVNVQKRASNRRMGSARVSRACFGVTPKQALLKMRFSELE